MNRPFVYPEHPEFKAHVEYVTEELMKHANDGMLTSTHHLRSRAEARAKDIVLWVTSKPVKDWHDLKIWSFGYFIGAGVTLLGAWLVSNL